MVSMWCSYCVSACRQRQQEAAPLIAPLQNMCLQRLARTTTSVVGVGFHFLNGHALAARAHVAACSYLYCLFEHYIYLLAMQSY